MAMPKAGLFGILVALSSYCFAILASGQISQPLELSALKAVHQQLKDPQKNLNNWKGNDPCTSNWTGVICIVSQDDGYLHVQELRLLNMNLSGNLAPELGQFSYMTILNFMWNNIYGSIPKELGQATSLKLLLLSGNQISGPLPDDLGYLPNLVRFQIDVNNISGQLPKSFANLSKVKHFNMNNNSISGQIPPEFYALPQLIHMMLDNNNLSGNLPPELSKIPNLTILQLDNNNFNGSSIPDSYGNMSKLLKLSLRNCNLQGAVPDLSNISGLRYLDLSLNHLTGSVPTNKLSENITTIDLSNNMLNGSIPSNFSGLPRLERLLLENNNFSGNVPSTIWQNMTFGTDARLTLDFKNNSLSNIMGSLDPPPNVTTMLKGNPVCTKANDLTLVQLCETTEVRHYEAPKSSNGSTNCQPDVCLGNDLEYVSVSPGQCFCAAPIGVGFQLRSPSISEFPPFIGNSLVYMTSSLGLDLYQLDINSFLWQEGPRLQLYLNFFPQYSIMFNKSELQGLVDTIATYSIPGSDIFGPYDLLNFTLLGPYSNVIIKVPESGMSKGVLAGIVLGAIFCVVAISLAIAFVFYINRRHLRNQHPVSKKQSNAKTPIKIDGVKRFSFIELEKATSSFSFTTQVGRGGYGKVYKGILADGTVVAIKRAEEGSLQGQREFFTEIELLSRLHHRNLVSLVGYCDEEAEQILVYEFMPNGSLHSQLSARSISPPSFAMRLHIAMGSAKGILYLHTEADPPIIHRDIKANNILLDSKLTAKVADFGISKLAPVPDGGDVTTHVSTGVKGTPGYLDPDYFSTNQLTQKSDVYSLGIVFLELLTGMPPMYHGRYLVREVEEACRLGMTESIIDKRMVPYSSENVKKLMELALRCSKEKTLARPSMLEVVRELENISSMPPESDTIPSAWDASTSRISEIGPSSVNYAGNDHVSCDISTMMPR